MPPSISGYSGTPLPKKHGIKQGFVVSLIGAPDDFDTTLGRLPDGVDLRGSMRGKFDLSIWFVRSESDLDRNAERVLKKLGPAGVWIAWPKKSSSMKSDLSEELIRNAGLTRGLVDFKVCAIDGTWSGLKFQKRLKG